MRTLMSQQATRAHLPRDTPPRVCTEAISTTKPTPCSYCESVTRGEHVLVLWSFLLCSLIGSRTEHTGSRAVSGEEAGAELPTLCLLLLPHTQGTQLLHGSHAKGQDCKGLHILCTDFFATLSLLYIMCNIFSVVWWQTQKNHIIFMSTL